MHYLISSLSCWVMVFPRSLELDVGDRHTDGEGRWDSVIKLSPRWSPARGGDWWGLWGRGHWMRDGQCSQGMRVCACMCVCVWVKLGHLGRGRHVEVAWEIGSTAKRRWVEATHYTGGRKGESLPCQCADPVGEILYCLARLPTVIYKVKRKCLCW